jgi:hypothetical protein
MVLKSGSETEGFRYTEFGNVNGPSGLSSACVGDTASDGGLLIAAGVVLIAGKDMLTKFVYETTNESKNQLVRFSGSVLVNGSS